jgi:hypothetical protein
MGPQSQSGGGQKKCSSPAAPQGWDRGPEKILSKIVYLQSQLIATKGKDNKEVMRKIAQLRNEVKNDFNDPWGIQISELIS